MFSTQNVKMYASILTDYLSCISPTSVAGGGGGGGAWGNCPNKYVIFQQT